MWHYSIMIKILLIFLILTLNITTLAIQPTTQSQYDEFLKNIGLDNVQIIQIKKINQKYFS